MISTHTTKARQFSILVDVIYPPALEALFSLCFAVGGPAGCKVYCVLPVLPFHRSLKMNHFNQKMPHITLKHNLVSTEKTLTATSSKLPGDV